MDSAWNFVDAIGKFSMFIYFILNLAGYSNQGNWVRELESYLLVLGTCAQFLRAINALKVVDSFRSLIKLLTATMFDMIPFLTVLFLMIGMVGMVDLIVHKHQLENVDRKLWVSIVHTYKVMLGDNPKTIEFKQSKLFLFVYFGMTIVLNTMTLNLLISIISTTYARLDHPDMVKSINVKQKAEMLSEIESLMVQYRNSGKEMYLHQLKYDFGIKIDKRTEEQKCQDIVEKECQIILKA